MTKNNILIGLIIIFFAVIFSCNTSKNSIQIKLNDIDSAIRVVVPSHNCGCNWQDKKSDIYISPIFKQFRYSWQVIFVKSIDSIDLINDSKKVFQQLVKLDKRYTDFKRFFLEYRVQEKNDSSQYKAVGTWYQFENDCNGYISGIAVKELEKNTALINDRKKLCK